MARGTWGGATDPHPVQVRISFLLGTSTCQTGFKLRDSSLTPLDLADCAAEVADFVTTSFRTLFSVEDRMLGVDVLDMTNGEGHSVSFSNSMGTQNLTGSSLLPTYVQVPVSMKGELRRRYGQGRMLWPVRFDGWNDRDILNATGAAALQGVIDNLAGRYLGTGGSTDYTLINVHGLIDPTEATPTTPARPAVQPSYYDVTSLRLNTVMSFVKSRKQGVGS